MNLYLVSPVLMLLVGPLFGQTQDREFVTATCPYKVGSESGSIGVRSTAPNTLRWTVLNDSTTGASATLTLPFDLPGQPTYIGNRQFLVPGRNAGDGRAFILRIALQESPRAIQVAECVDYGTDIDPYAVLWRGTESILYVYDFKNKWLYAAPFSGAGLPGLVAFTLAATPATVPALDSGCYTLELIAPPGTTNGVGVYDTATPMIYKMVRQVSPGSWVVIAGGLGNQTPKQIWDVAGMGRINIAAPIMVGGIVATAKLRERVFQNQTVSEVAVTSTGGLVPFPAPVSPLIPGLHYEIGSDGNSGIASFLFQGLIRYGDPQKTDRLEMSAGQVSPTGCWIGNSDFGIRGWLWIGTGATTQTSAQVYLLMGARHADGTDPVADVNGVKVLSEVLAVLGPEPATVVKNGLSLPVHIHLPVPADQGLVGGVLLWQWLAVTDDLATTVSDVFGAMVTAQWPTSGGAASGQRAAPAGGTTYPRVSETALAAVRMWSSSRADWRVEGRKALVWQRALGR